MLPVYQARASSQRSRLVDPRKGINMVHLKKQLGLLDIGSCESSERRVAADLSGWVWSGLRKSNGSALASLVCAAVSLQRLQSFPPASKILHHLFATIPMPKIFVFPDFRDQHICSRLQYPA